MATPTLDQILTAIETRLETIEGLLVADIVPGSINPPQAVVGVPAIGNYHSSLGGRRPALEPTVTVLTSAAIDRLGQLQLAAYADPEGPQSIPQAFDADRTLGGVVNDCLVVRFQPLGLQDVGIVGYFGGVFTLRIAT